MESAGATRRAAATGHPGPGGGRGAATRAKILERSVDLASVEGLEGLTIGRLARERGMSKSGLFAHFGSKEELQLATVEAAAERFRQAVVVPASVAEEGLPRLRALVTAYIAHIEGGAYPGGCFWASTSAEYDDRSGPVRDAIAAAIGAWIAELERQAAIAGLEDPALAAFEIHALVTGANARFRLWGDRRVFDQARTAVTPLLGQRPA